MASWDCLLRCYMNYLPVIAEGRLSIPTTFSLWTCETMLPYASLVTDEHCLSCASVLSPCHFCDEERGQRDLSALKSLLSGHFITATETERGLRWSLIWIGEMRWLSQQEHLLHKCKDLSSNPQHSRKKLGGGVVTMTGSLGLQANNLAPWEMLSWENGADSGGTGHPASSLDSAHPHSVHTHTPQCT